MRLLFISWPPEGKILHAVPSAHRHARIPFVRTFFFNCFKFVYFLCVFSAVRAASSWWRKAVHHQVEHCQELFGVNRLLVISVCIHLSTHEVLHDSKPNNSDIVWVLTWWFLEWGDRWQPTSIYTFSCNDAIISCRHSQWRPNADKYKTTLKPHMSTSIAHSPEKIFYKSICKNTSKKIKATQAMLSFQPINIITNTQASAIEYLILGYEV